MTLWERIAAILESARESTLGAVMDAMEERRKKRDAAVFSIALIALSAKMAKADGIATDDEFAAFLDFFEVPPGEESRVRTVYDLAKSDVGGFESYARQVGKLFGAEEAVLEDVLDCLFYVAMADGVLHPGELELLNTAKTAFGLSEDCFRRVKASHVGLEEDDPYAVLGVPLDITTDDLKKSYRQLAKEHHPDAMVARGVPPSLVSIAEHRMAAINEAYEKVMAEREAA
ncbi:DnaJ domain-containing protein [Parvularcula sp. ZS-1/3]|uniref:DnaJ domain-containing protein n=1 Tax=Parvularcula mediterranea TaxID=2732508 RepID=A0A7Y3RNF3_9PROT|nr:TerB family tellurite resistance protein [Parvularcula mediterranea]NNU17312.1 DnaJ domain-containing protein [Parvularcula mediterranea]